MKCEDLNDIPEKQPSLPEPDDKDFLYETLGTGSKSIENPDAGFAVNFEPRIRQLNFDDRSAINGNANTDDNLGQQLSRNQITVNKQQETQKPTGLRDECPHEQRFAALRKDEEDKSKSKHKASSTDSTVDEPTSNFMRIQWNQIPYLLKERADK
jgi:hypothetical protein